MLKCVNYTVSRSMYCKIIIIKLLFCVSLFVHINKRINMNVLRYFEYISISIVNVFLFRM